MSGVSIRVAREEARARVQHGVRAAHLRVGLDHHRNAGARDLHNVGGTERAAVWEQATSGPGNRGWGSRFRV
eukprot:209076-Chlamydomonas_euryale.AAC.3